MKKTNKSANDPESSLGFSIMKAILFLFVTTLVFSISVIIFYEGRKAYWDSKVEELCQKKGGVRIYEKDSISKKYVERDGTVSIPFEKNATQEDDYCLRVTRNSIVDGRVSVGETKTELIRTKDNKVLAEFITYGRSGGDFIALSHPSYYYCKTDNNPIDFMVSKVFLITD
ncbi:hypothetical protein [Thiohalophilus sp.]|uniref:hypothetical protein n=1 Tax=Thiohalophilus sp. TaxID=3028392 RepID=UPI002ACE083B|nr:hypothetical protein [Thiohalophilus sp.]MDZ7805102.1 hypothetical protein [Thiohalophilus sp.]